MGLSSSHLLYEIILISFIEFSDATMDNIKVEENGSGGCSSVDGVLACKPKGCWFYSQSGHMPGLWSKAPVGGT